MKKRIILVFILNLFVTFMTFGRVWEVEIENFLFTPSELTISIGDVVRWTNKDAMVHTATADNSFFDSGSINPNSSFQFTFNNPGTYNYHCQPHPWMVGKIIVKGLSKVNVVDLPLSFQLNQNYPNPFNPSTIITYNLPYDSKVKVVLYSIIGKEVKVLENSFKSRGYHQIELNASDLSSGTYIYKLTAGNVSEFIASKKLIVSK